MTESQAEAGPQVSVQKIYVKDASSEVPNAPRIFTEEWKPQVDVQINTAVEVVADDTHQVSLGVTVTAKLGESTAYLVEVEQAGIFRLTGFGSDEEQKVILGAYCPNVLFPYLRETVSNLVQRAGFPPFLMQPVNFDALFREYQRQAEQPASPAAAH